MGSFSISETGSGLIWRGNHETVLIEAWRPDSLRVRATKNRDFTGNDWALLPVADAPAPSSPAADMPTCKIDAGKVPQITNGNITASVTKAGRITFTNQRGQVLLTEYARNFKEWGGFASALNLDQREYKGSSYGNHKISQRFESVPDERLYGMGQYQQPMLNLKGCALELAQRNSQVSVPFAVSSLGYGFLWNNPAIGRVTFGRNMTEWTAESAKEIDYWITVGDTPAEIVESYAGVTGYTPMMPDYAMGFWQCKLRYQTQEELLGVAREYKRRGLPISVIVIDFCHGTYHGDWQFDERYWPDPEAMVRELAGLGIELVVSFWPTVEAMSENCMEMKDKGYLVQSERGLDATMLFQAPLSFYDATNPEAREFVWEKVKENYYDIGIKNFWLDVAEPEFAGNDYDNFRYHIGPVMETGNIYPVYYARNFYEGLKSCGEENIISLIRSAWAGSQRYGALVWSGDVHSSFKALREQIPAGLNIGLAGIPWWTTDIGGFNGGNINDPAFIECLIRWFQYGAFCPVFRLHGDRLPRIAPVGTDGCSAFRSGGPNEVWSFGEDALRIFERYMQLREKMRPYIKRIMREAHEKGTPPMRPLFYDFPEDKKCWEVEDQYMFGPEILVAPVLYEGAKSREVYLPEGCVWIQLCDSRHSDGKSFNGGQTLDCPTPIDEIPVFIKEGVNNPLAP